MLLELRAENYAVIDRAVATFGRGLNLLTGETGAGKSILIDALALLLGGKASADFVRHGAEKAVVGCVFEMTPGARAILEANGVDADADEATILLRREITAAGKGRVFINNQPATVGVLRLLAPELALVHSQGETLGAFDAVQQRTLLDRFGAVATDAVGEAFRAWRETTAKLEELETDEQDRLRMADLWRFQTGEIDGAAIAAEDEDLQLEAEKRVLANSEKLYSAAMNAHELLYEAEQSVESMLGAALKHVEELAKYDARFEGPAQQLAAAKAGVEDVDAEVRDFAENVHASPERLEEIEDRLEALDRLKRKYGKTLGEVIAFGADAAGKLAEVENRDALLAELKGRQAADAARYEAAAGAVTAARTAAASRLEKRSEAQINDLAMKTKFHVRVTADRATDAWTAHGWDTVECLIATNAGEPLKPLEEIASGGEMSRVMLALKVTVEEEASGVKKGKKTLLPRTLVFDEIDIGIGGRAAEAVGQKLKTLSVGQQVLCITHLPQIAAFADQHFLIAKTEKAGRTHTDVRRMEEGERVEEIARMLSGAKLTETSLLHARHLVETSR
ncbi:DNA replication and repair protein RecN [Granulicella pectinivorans]|uniref:DNA repair protein RecN n=1 Tax=Granulicella pectinivorans TaxID=474950 RepID=A0A1I6MK51_9BACT|nr:DNA repair protein RecN [Granulicella pectinivorans]SFS15987.1 DNA replication and repair protein RecN [Granulicella pectinivorans]